MRRALAFALTAAVLLAGCGSDKSREDARDTQDIDKTPPHAIGFNNKYPNVETKCGAPGWRVFVTTGEHHDRLVVVRDLACKGTR